MTLKMIIAEDEQSFREGIVHAIDWMQYDIEIIGEAENGRQALDMIVKHPPDLLLTDIRMPHMNGLDVIREAQTAGLHFHTILLTGYNEFEYAKEAIKLGVSDYLLKPCMPHDIIRVVLDVKKKIIAEAHEDNYIADINRTWNRSIPLIKNQILSQWIQQPLMPLEDRATALREFDMSLQPGAIEIGLIDIDAQADRQIHSSQRDLELIRYAMLNIAEETLRPLYGGALEVFRHGDELLWIGNRGIRSAADAAMASMQTLKHNLEGYLKLSVSLAISSVQASINNAHSAYKEALEAMEERFYQGKGGIYLFSEMKQQQSSKTSILDDHYLERIEKEWLGYLQNEQFGQAVDAMDSALAYIKEHNHYSRSEVIWRISSIIMELQKFAKERYATSIEWQDELVNWMDNMPTMETLDDGSVILQKIVQSIVKVASNQKQLHRTVHATLELIKNKYNTNLTLDLAAKETFVSNSYLSFLFKQELGINFLDYLHQYRVEQAKTLLREDYKIYAVAKQVGYQEERHFSSTFKKWTGITPRQYQKSHMRV